MPTASESRKVARTMMGEGEVSLKDFLGYGTPEFREKLGEDPQEFLEETEKVTKRLPCSSTKVVELVGMRIKRNAWN